MSNGDFKYKKGERNFGVGACYQDDPDGDYLIRGSFEELEDAKKRAEELKKEVGPAGKAHHVKVWSNWKKCAVCGGDIPPSMDNKLMPPEFDGFFCDTCEEKYGYEGLSRAKKMRGQRTLFGETPKEIPKTAQEEGIQSAQSSYAEGHQVTIAQRNNQKKKIKELQAKLSKAGIKHQLKGSNTPKNESVIALPSLNKFILLAMEGNRKSPYDMGIEYYISSDRYGDNIELYYDSPEHLIAELTGKEYIDEKDDREKRMAFIKKHAPQKYKIAQAAGKLEDLEKKICTCETPIPNVPGRLDQICIKCGGKISKPLQKCQLCGKLFTLDEYSINHEHTCNQCAGEKIKEMPYKELIAEHEELVQVMEKGTPAEKQKVLEEQKQELKQYKKEARARGRPLDQIQFCYRCGTIVRDDTYYKDGLFFCSEKCEHG